MKDPRDIIKRPIVTEQSVTMQERNVYTFEVEGSANKIEIAKAIESIFEGTKVARVNTMWVPAKRRRFGRHVGFTSKWKKAMVTLRPESKPIEFFAEG
ncbi:MAG: 50S ribosomal protein L23 [Firmicutes bacterium]|nr:50S ribosomal protein L23 [Bacillota bacterium]